MPSSISIEYGYHDIDYLILIVILLSIFASILSGIFLLKSSVRQNTPPLQKGNRLHYLADRASIIGKFIKAEYLKFDEVLSHFISQMELILATGEIDPRYAHCVTLYHNGFTCEADILGSCGYVYIAVYPTNVNYFHKSTYENSTCNNSVGGDAMSVAHGSLINAACTPAGTILWPDTHQHTIQ